MLNAMPRLPKAAILKLRKADPKLTIRPFRSKVTFSEDTKGTSDKLPCKSMYHVPIAKPSRGMRQDGVDLTISSPELSEADLLTAYIEHRDQNSPRSPTTRNAPPLSPLVRSKGVTGSGTSGSCQQRVAGKMTSSSRSIEESQRESFSDEVPQSIFPTDLIAAIGLPSEYWLRHQSLPNIQEIGEEGSASGSPTARISFRRHQTAESECPSSTLEKRTSIKRQKAQEGTPPKEGVEFPDQGHHKLLHSQSLLTRKGSAEEKRRLYSTGGDNSSSNSIGSVSTLPPTTRRYRKRVQQPPRIPIPGSSRSPQHSKPSSTESESSYVTARSFYIQISEEDETSPIGQPTEDVESNRAIFEEPSSPTSRSKPTLVDLQKSSQSTSSSFGSYSSAKDVFVVDTSGSTLNIPSIVVVQSATGVLSANGTQSQASQVDQESIDKEETSQGTVS